MLFHCGVFVRCVALVQAPRKPCDWCADFRAWRGRSNRERLHLSRPRAARMELQAHARRIFSYCDLARPFACSQPRNRRPAPTEHCDCCCNSRAIAEQSRKIFLVDRIRLLRASSIGAFAFHDFGVSIPGERRAVVLGGNHSAIVCPDPGRCMCFASHCSNWPGSGPVCFLC